MKHKSVLMACAASLVVAACGGGGVSPAATEQVPASASMSTTGFVTYLKVLVASAADTLEPVDTSLPPPPADDSSEPTTVD